MRRILLFIVPLLFCVFVSTAQNLNPENDAAMQLVSSSKATLGLSAEDLSNVMVSSTYLDNATGIRMVYLNQTYKGIPVLNQMLVLAFKNGKVVSNFGGLNKGMEKFANSQTGIPSVSAESAVQSALSDRGLRATQMSIALNTKDNGRLVEFSNMGVSRENITAQLIWTTKEKTNEMHLAWQVKIVPKVNADYWMVSVDAIDNSILGMDNYTDYDNWGHSPAENRSLNYPSFMTISGQAELAAKSGNINLFDFKRSANTDDPKIITTATYRVVPYPAESPWAAGGSFATRTDPWLAAPGNATSLKWHTGFGGIDYAYTRGNNVWAYEDRTPPANTASQAKSANSTTALPNLTFNFVNDTTQSPILTSPPNQQFNITNLFYWNNIVHDIMYIYGFNEVTGNFQDDNQGRGGLGSDYVFGEAQDAGGTNNANFSTPPDGQNGRMQMYLFNLGGSNPLKDGDIDNGIVTHEFGHGISNRLTGGPANSGCLGNAEQMGEGISDYYSMMFTQNWATSTLNTGFSSPRGLGLYALNGTNLFGGSPPGTGIRHLPYTTNFAINNQVYATVIPAESHDRGEIWAATLWDMTWNIINQVGTINPNLYDLAGGGGNTIALKLVTEGLRLQQCSPGFISARNAILQADQTLYGGAYSCSIWEAFRRRGMGAFASEGSTSSVTDQTPDFSAPATMGAVVSALTIPEGQNLTYTNTVTTCGTITGYTLRDTLPTNVTYASGGTYDAVNRVVSFPVAQGAGATNYVFTVTVNLGSYFPPATLINEPVAGATIPASWTTSAPLGSLWTVVSTQSNSAPNSFFAVNLGADGDERLETTNAIALPANSNPKLSFWHRWNTEDGWDGGVVEISTNGGTSWTDLGPNMIQNGYNGALGVSPANPIGGQPAFTGLTPGAAFVNTIINLGQYAGQSVKLRFRFGSDNNTSAPTSPAGWWVDDILLTVVPAVNMRTSFFNASNTRVSLKDMVTEITQFIVCAPVINTQPVNSTICTNSTTTFTCVGVSTVPVTYQWQLSTAGAGGPWNNLTNVAPYSGVTTSTLTINPTAVGMNGYQYRCIVTGGCAPNATSNAAILTVIAASVGGNVTPANSNACGLPNGGTLTLSGYTGTIVRWESATNIAGPYTPIVNTSTTLTYTNINVTTYYRAVVQVPGAGCVPANSSIATVTFTAAQSMQITADPGTTLCQGDPALLTASNAPITFTYTSAGGLTIPSSGTATPYPLPLAVAGVPAGATVSQVRINGFSHTWSGDVDIAVTGPTFVGGGNVQAAMLMSDLGNDALVVANNVNLTFDDAAAGFVPTTSPMASGTYKCTNNGAQNDIMPAPGPNLNVANPLLTALNAATMNGTWNLWVNDQVGGDAGSIASYTIIFSIPGGPIVGGTYTWTPAAGLNQTTGNPVGASPAATTTYTVFHDNGAGCVRQASITLNINTRPAVTAQPANVTVCNGTPATFTVGATATGILYQWQLSTTGAGGPWIDLTNAAPYSGVNTATLTVNPATVAMSGYRYRCVISGVCPPNAVSNGAILTVSALPTVTVTPNSGCGGVAGTNGLLLTASGANSYSWAPQAGLYIDANAILPYLGQNTPIVYAAPTSFTTYIVTGTNTTTGCSNTAQALVNYTPPAPTITPSSVTMCLGDAPVKLKSSSSTTTTVSFSSGTVNVVIPDGPNIPPVPASYPASVSNITVSGIPATCNVANIRVKFNITHAYVGDCVIALKAPNGKIFNLDAMLNRTNNPGANFTNTVISSSGSTLLSAGTAPFTATFRPDAAGATFVAFGFTFPGGPVGYVPNTTLVSDLYPNPNGVWSVGIYDAGAPDAGVLNNWSLDIDYVCGVPSTPAVWTPVGGLFSDATGLTAYVAGTAVDSVWAKPTPSGVYPYQARVQSLSPPPAVVTTPMAGGNGNNSVAFNVANNNSVTMNLTAISTNTFGSGAIVASAFYKITPIAGNPGLINAANGWIQFGGPTPSNVTAGALNAVLSGLSLPIPAGQTYGIVLSLTGATFPAYTNGAATTVTYTNNNCSIITGGNVGWGGPAAPGPMVNNPRNFNGAVYLSAANVAPCISPARTVIVTVNQPVNIGAVSANQAICTDKVAAFSVSGITGSGPLNYQWQESTNSGSTYNNISNGGVYSGATTATLTITAPPVTMSGYYYRCIVTGAAPCAPVTSFFRVLTVYPLPTVLIGTPPGTPPYVTSLFPGLRRTITSTVSPFAADPNGGYTWLRDGVVVPNEITGSLTVDIDRMGTYQLRVKDVNGCTNLSNTYLVKDSVNGKCFIYPNPNSGMFQVRYYSVANNVVPRSLTVYDAKGDRVLTQFYTIGRPYDRMDVDIRKHGKGLYWVEIGDMNGNRLTMCRIVVQ